MTSTTSYRVAKPISTTSARSSARTSTCDTCKSRHQKCDGAQPQCSNCELRAISCSYSSKNTHTHHATPNKAPTLLSTTPNSRLQISNSDYDRLYSQIFDDIIQRLKVEGHPNSGIVEPVDTYSGPCSASLPSFYQEVSNIIKEELSSNSRQMSLQMDANAPLTNQIKDLSLVRNLDHVRKILRNSLPPQDVGQRLLNLFFQYQNSIFYVCDKRVAQEQLNLMYKDLKLTSVSWFCQMFSIFAVGAQFDDLDDGAGESYYQISQKCLDDAIEESPQNTLWVMRAMLLLCFYQPPTKWFSIWIHLDVAIRTAHRFQLDLGQNLSKEFSGEEYQEWRQIWLTVIAFDRWVAIFLGRLPRIEDSISKDPVFKDLHFVSGLDSCVMQNHVTSLAIISGHVLRDMYFSEQRSLSVSQQRKLELETWTATLPDLLRKPELNAALDLLPKDQSEAAFNLHFMRLGTWMLLSRPSLFKVVKTSELPINFAGPMGSALSSDARVCLDSAFWLISSAATILSESLSPKRSFMPLFFLVNAAHVMILGAVLKMKQNDEGEGYDSIMSYEQSRELTSIDASTRILDLCGQRIAFARKYSVLIKDLRQNLNKHMLDLASRVTPPDSALTQASSLNMPFIDSTFSASPQTPSNSSTSTSTTESQGYQDLVGAMNLNDGTSTPPLHSTNTQPSYYPSIASATMEPWSEHLGIFYPTNETSSQDSSNLLNDSESDFSERMWQ